MNQTSAYLQALRQYCAPNHAPLPVVLSHGSGAWVTDVEGKTYLDLLAGFAALSHGHAHPELIEALQQQASKLTLMARVYVHDQLAALCESVCHAADQEQALLMNTGSEAVETAFKLARRWAYRKKGIADEKAEIIACVNNFHGRTLSILSCSSEPAYRAGFGPFTPGFKVIPFGDATALAEAITPNTAAVLLEPIQVEGGLHLPPPGFLASVRQLCSDHNVLMILDEIHTGLGRCGRMFAYELDEIKPDVLLLGKSLGGGMIPISAVLSSREIMGVFTPGSHGSTFAGNPLACAVALRALAIIKRDEYPKRASRLGSIALGRLHALARQRPEVIQEVRGKGLLIGIELTPTAQTARFYCERLVEAGVLTIEANDRVMRLTPPLMISESDLDLGLSRVEQVMKATYSPSASQAFVAS